MGGGSWTDDAYQHIRSTSFAGKSTAQVFTKTSTAADMSPRGVMLRESRDSDEHPESLAVGIVCDVTGSMNKVVDKIVRDKMGTTMDTMTAHGVEHPQVMICAVGDHLSDRSPFQVGQYESAPAPMMKWCTDIHIERNGGGGGHESYFLPWIFFGQRTSIDCFEKRGQKGFLFTMGDEWMHKEISPSKYVEIFGGEPPSEPISYQAALAMAQRMYHVFHIHINDASYPDNEDIFGHWRELLGQNFLVLDNHENVAELIGSTVAVVHGADLAKVTKAFSGSAALSVRNALSGLTVPVKPGNEGIVAL